MENYLERKDSSASLEERRTPRVGVFQIGVDPVKIRELLKREPIQHLAQMLLSKFMGRKVILSADRLDYTKGILQKIEAYEVFLARHPEFKERVQLILIVGPCRMDLQVYNQLNQEISLLVQVINGKHGTSSWDPIYFINRTMPYEELLAYYRVADIALVTPLEDGMNLIAKEYLYVKGGEGGALILSKNAGAAVELQDAYQVDPTKIEEIASALRESLLASESDIISRNTKMLEHLVQQTVVKWMHDFVATLE
jgi:trehalose 6-phosphate synthase/phosphatase